MCLGFNNYWVLLHKTNFYYRISMPNRASSINHVEKRGEGRFPKKTMFVHKGEEDQKCPKICPYGLWMTPKYGRSLTWFMLGTWWKRHVWIEIKVHWKLPLFYAGVRTCWRLQYPFAWGQSKEWIPSRKFWGNKTSFCSISS